MRGWTAVVALVFAVLCGPAVSQSLAALAVMAVPPLGDAVPGGTIAVGLTPAPLENTTRDWICYSIDLQPGDAKWPNPTDQTGACLLSGTAGPEIMLKAPKARGTLLIEAVAGETLEIPYAAPPGTHQHIWAGVDRDGHMRAGNDVLEPWHARTAFVWAGIQALAIFAGLALVALHGQARWLLAAFGVALLALLFIKDYWPEVPHVSAGFVLLMGGSVAGLRLLAAFWQPWSSPAPPKDD